MAAVLAVQQEEKNCAGFSSIQKPGTPRLTASCTKDTLRSESHTVDVLQAEPPSTLQDAVWNKLRVSSKPESCMVVGI